MTTETVTELAPGTEVGSLTVRLTREQLVRYAGASGDFNPIHYSDHFATALGLPGVIAHGRFEEVLPAEIKAALKETNVVKRFGSPEDIAAMGALLMSDEGAFITGQVIHVDGGTRRSSS